MGRPYRLLPVLAEEALAAESNPYRLRETLRQRLEWGLLRQEAEAALHPH